MISGEKTSWTKSFDLRKKYRRARFNAALICCAAFETRIPSVLTSFSWRSVNHFMSLCRWSSARAKFLPMSMLHKLDCKFPSLGFKMTTMVFIYLPFALPLSTDSLGDPSIRGFEVPLKVPLKVEIERKEFFIVVTVIRLDILAGPAQTLQERHKSDL